MTNLIADLEAFKNEQLAPIVAAGQLSISDAGGDTKQLLQIALANEINVAELAAAWMPSTPELEVKLAFARQTGDEAGHFLLVAERLTLLGLDVRNFAPPPGNPMFEFLRGLTTTVERVAAGLFTLESIAYGVNENFMALCAARGDHETVRIYREYIQPDEKAHQESGQRLLAKYATTPELAQLARDTIGKLLELAAHTRAAAATRLGTACFPGC
ncbi:MAG: ferritin-like domain-containing protein [Deltaproteobacteria bacterium]|nr:ferritin-like domain-containing protein [Deltaproteobacteria bacterium]MDQ3298181.1 ferritin-like domain-containing protein [Myxococcota bacterium]